MNTTDLSALSRDELAARIDAWDFRAPAEAARRLRLDSDLAARLARAEPSEESRAWLMTYCQDQGELRGGERVDALVMAFQHLVRERDELRQVVTTYESTCERYQDRIASLESQLAANGKGGESFAVGDKVHVQAVYGRSEIGSFDGVVERGDEEDDIVPYKVVPLRPVAVGNSFVSHSVWCEAQYVTHLPPEPAKPAEPQKSPLQAILDDARRRATVGAPWPSSSRQPVEPAAEGKGVRSTIEIGVDMLACAKSWDPAVRIIGNVRADEIAHFVQASIEEHDKLQRVLSGVAEIAAHADRQSKLAYKHGMNASGDDYLLLTEKLRGLL